MYKDLLDRLSPFLFISAICINFALIVSVLNWLMPVPVLPLEPSSSYRECLDKNYIKCKNIECMETIKKTCKLTYERE